MNIVTGIVLYAIIWFMTLFVILPLRMKTQNDAGHRVAGTPGSAPQIPHLMQRFIITTAVAAAIWGIIATLILTQAITIEDIDLFTRFGLGQAG